MGGGQTRKGRGRLRSGKRCTIPKRARAPCPWRFHRLCPPPKPASCSRHAPMSAHYSYERGRRIHSRIRSSSRRRREVSVGHPMPGRSCQKAPTWDGAQASRPGCCGSLPRASRARASPPPSAYAPASPARVPSRDVPPGRAEPRGAWPRSTAGPAAPCPRATSVESGASCRAPPRPPRAAASGSPHASGESPPPR